MKSSFRSTALAALTLASAALLPAVSHAAVYRCTDKSGKVTFTEVSCASSAQQAVVVKNPVPRAQMTPEQLAKEDLAEAAAARQASHQKSAGGRDPS